jgi:hypothetical protein
MAIKLKLYAICEACGQPDARREGDMIRGGHVCPKAPPGPVDPPYFFHVGQVNFIDNRDKRVTQET